MDKTNGQDAEPSIHTARARKTTDPSNQRLPTPLNFPAWSSVASVNMHFAITLDFNAFIPDTLGSTSFAGTDYNWAKEPGPGNAFNWAQPKALQDNYYYFGTDNRHVPNAPGTSRIHTEVTLDSASVGSAIGAAALKSGADPSHEAVGVQTPQGPVIGATGILSTPAPVFSKETVTDTSPGSTDIEVEASGSYPFAFYSPDIVIDIIWHLRRGAGNTVRVSVSGVTSEFPAYEGIANGVLVYSRQPADSGPGFFNLGHLRSKTQLVSGSVVLPGA